MYQKQQTTIMKNVIIFSLFSVFFILCIKTIHGYINVAKEYGSQESNTIQTWSCADKDRCEKSFTSERDKAISLETCQMTCGNVPPLWPKPTQLEIIRKDASTFMKEHVFLTIHSPNDKVKGELEEAANTFINNLGGSNSYVLQDKERRVLKLNIHVREADLTLRSTTDEEYALYSQKLDDTLLLVNIFASNYYGARHGLETLSQLIWYDHITKRFRIIHDVKIIDKPAFRHRGLLIDVSRHFVPIKVLRKAVEGMAASKMNVLHLHLSDSSSFPLILPRNEDFAIKGSYNEESRYTPEDIKKLVEYARKRGVRTIMEIDAPSHVTPSAWPKEEILCNNPDMFKTTLNPDNPNALKTLESIYRDLLELGTDKETFHIGDDEVITSCWTNTDSARQLHNDVYKVWVNFTNAMLERVKLANNGTMPKNVVLWSSPLTDRYIHSLTHQEELVVQYWFGQLKGIMESNFKIIFSTVGQWYLDCGFGPWKKSEANGACDPYTNWRKFYKYRPWNEFPQRLDQVLGGEVCLWTEEVDAEDVETRLWPRTAAFAERVWSDPAEFDRSDVFRRIDFHSRRLRARGLRVASIWPEVCSQYPERC
ncbi:probable beta-hexosaminidase fdl [Anthonomus grandis grandis]|uniref:probable beta-hexosaminidase fdl n=1 Tax=Anthonomus grandis grandis TaxID=2921223 RepID=UPI002166B72B|nr:probable beta-hexosaminidase fdl [Anthonomus grandis grandis]